MIDRIQNIYSPVQFHFWERYTQSFLNHGSFRTSPGGKVTQSSFTDDVSDAVFVVVYSGVVCIVLFVSGKVNVHC